MTDAPSGERVKRDALPRLLFDAVDRVKSKVLYSPLPNGIIDPRMRSRLAKTTPGSKTTREKTAQIGKMSRRRWFASNRNVSPATQGNIMTSMTDPPSKTVSITPNATIAMTRCAISGNAPCPQAKTRWATATSAITSPPSMVNRIPLS